jgi:CCR4-NOT transcription complex subunit 1
LTARPAGSCSSSDARLFCVPFFQRDAEERGPAFNPRPYFRLFAALVMSLGASDPVLDATNIQTLVPIASALLQVQPLRVPGFSFAYLELISHRNILPRLLQAPGQKGWPLFQRLLSVMPKFMEPYLRNAKLSEPVRLLYKGTLRVLLVLLHDFPEFLCDHHFNLCDNIPPSCIQMRNLILSAFPRNMRLPDPFTPNLKVDLLPEISQSPRILAEPEHVFRNKHLHQEVDHYLKTRLPSTFCSDLRQRLLLPPHEAMACGTHYNVPLLNALVLYVGIQAIAQLQSKSPQVQSPITQSAPMDVFQRLVTELDTEGRYLLLNAIANQLRYPNNHTHYFSCVLLFLFAEAQNEMIQEQITRVLLERLIVNRPHPWGLLITFIELIKNPRYNFWSHSFTRCAPEIEKLFESVARSCMGPPPRPSDDELGGVVAGVAGLQVADNN